MSEVTVKFSVNELEDFAARVAQAVVTALQGSSIPTQATAQKQSNYQTAQAQPGTQPPQYQTAPTQQPSQPHYQAPVGFPYQMPPQTMPTQQISTSPASPSFQTTRGQPGTPLPTQGQPTITLEALSTACGRYAVAGDAQRQQILGLMQQFGVNAMTALSPEQYGAFAAKLREIGVPV